MGDLSPPGPYRVGMQVAVWDATWRCEPLWERLAVSGHTVHRMHSSPGLDRLEPWQLHAVCVVVDSRSEGGARLGTLRDRGYCGPLLALASTYTKELLAAGADDCLRDHVAVDELVERIRAIARRTGPYVVGPLVVEPVTLRAWLRGRELKIRRSDIALLAHLASSTERPVSIQDLGRQIFDVMDIERNRIDVAIWRIRKALEHDAWLLETVPAAGYRLRQRRDEQ